MEKLWTINILPGVDSFLNDLNLENFLKFWPGWQASSFSGAKKVVEVDYSV